MEKLKTLEARFGPLERCEDVVGKVSAKALREALGAKLGAKVFDAVRGVDETPWIVRPARKSVGAQMSWGVRCPTMDVAEDFVRQLAADVSARLRTLGKIGVVVHLKLWRALPNAAELMKRESYLGHGPCDVLSRSKVMLEATAETAAIAKEAVSVLWDLRVAPEDIRGLGVMVNKLDDVASAQTPAAKNQRTIAQMFATRPKVVDEGAIDETNDAPAPSAVRASVQIAESDEELAETEGSESDAEDVDFTQSLTQNNQDWNVFASNQEVTLDKDIALDDNQSIERAYQSAARCFAWNRYELARLNISKRRRDTLSEDIYARKTVARSIEVITTHAKRRKEQGGVDGLRDFLDFSRALCRRQEVVDTNADFIIAWLGAIEDIERALE
jgi:DNA repair protein REV1